MTMDSKLTNDYAIDLATAGSRLSKTWKNKHWQWSELVDKCRKTVRTHETAAEYTHMAKDEQSSVKDVGGFVGGYLRDGVRKTNNVTFRSVATLDIDYGNEDVWQDFQLSFSFAAMLYSTHKHSAENPRYRLVFPLSRKVTPDEYEPLCRKIASELGMDLFDDSTYELARLFYWPSTSADAEYVFHCQDGPACDVDRVLATYTNFRDVSEWPTSSREGRAIKREMKKVGDPTEKPGLIGAFCRAYRIEDAIETFLSDVYEPTTVEGRYTYKEGSVAGGLVCYEGKYAYSHHATDPASRELCNAFDLCRIHLFGAKDENSRTTDVTRLPSYKAMTDFAQQDGGVRRLLVEEMAQSVTNDFGDITVPEKSNDDWTSKMTFNKAGIPESTATNVMLILENDPRIAGKLRFNLFTEEFEVTGKLPWGSSSGAWRDSDDANLRVWLEQAYRGLSGKDKINDALIAVVCKNSYHPVKDYLSSLKWDGVERLDKLIIDYIGAEDNALTRAMTRKHFTAAVTRIYEPGRKYDYCLTLTGPEGAGKSTLLDKMGGEWFNDSIVTMEGKEGMESLRNTWVAELGELAGIKRSEVETVKSFLSRRIDIYRAAYAHRKVPRPRQCVFCGTTNEIEFLKGDNGNRRFWVVEVDPTLRKIKQWQQALDDDRDQLWAEAVQRYKDGEKLYLDEELETEARTRQKEHNDSKDDPWRELLPQFLNTLLPEGWSDMNVLERRRWLMDTDPTKPEGTVKRDRFRIAEFLQERVGVDVANEKYRYMARRVGALMKEIPGWVKIGSTRHGEKWYGRGEGYKREEEEEDL